MSPSRPTINVASVPTIELEPECARKLDQGGAVGPAINVVYAAQSWWMVACLTILGMLAMIDKNVITLLVLSIQKDLDLSRTQIGLVVGTAFAVGNLAVGIPAGWMTDRLHRKPVIAAGVVLWSGMAAICGFATSLASLFAARVGVGVSEGLMPPSAYSLIQDGVSDLSIHQLQRRSRVAVGASVFGAGWLCGVGRV